MSGERVLIVEDNAMNLELATDLLEIAGYIVTQAGTGEDGIKIAREEKPDLILMDIGLPGIDGLEATKILKGEEETKGIPVIALTAHAMKGDEEKAIERGCAGYITKPIDTRAFVEKVTCFIEPSGE